MDLKGVLMNILVAFLIKGQMAIKSNLKEEALVPAYGLGNTDHHSKPSAATEPNLAYGVCNMRLLAHLSADQRVDRRTVRKTG